MSVTKEMLGNFMVCSVWISNGNKKMKTEPVKKIREQNEPPILVLGCKLNGVGSTRTQQFCFMH